MMKEEKDEEGRSKHKIYNKKVNESEERCRRGKKKEQRRRRKNKKKISRRL